MISWLAANIENFSMRTLSTSWFFPALLGQELMIFWTNTQLSICIPLRCPVHDWLACVKHIGFSIVYLYINLNCYIHVLSSGHKSLRVLYFNIFQICIATESIQHVWHGIQYEDVFHIAFTVQHGTNPTWPMARFLRIWFSSRFLSAIRPSCPSQRIQRGAVLVLSRLDQDFQAPGDIYVTRGEAHVDIGWLYRILLYLSVSMWM